MTSRTRRTATDGKTVSGSASPIAVGGLRNGDRYTFTVTAANAVGTGPASDPSGEVTPADVPGAPSQASAARGPGKATVSFSAPADNGTPITGYTVTAHDKSDPTHTTDGKTVTATTGPIAVDGLRNGDRYTFTVTATNAVGTGPASDPSDETTPADVPGAPRQVSAVASDGQAVVSFIAPESDGGNPITGYEVVTHESAGAVTQTTRAAASLPVGGTKSPITLTGLANGHSYTFTVIASNAAGAGPSSDPSDAVIPAAVPGAPTQVSAKASDGEAVVSFAAPGSDNGSPITGYEVTAHDKSNPGDASDGKTVSGRSSPVTVSGLINGHSYSFTASATNAVGTGPSSEPSAPVTPTARQTPSSPGESPVNAPDARTEAAKDVKDSAATLAGTVGPEGLETAFRFEYGTSSSYGSTTSNGVAGAGMAPMPVSAQLQGLSPEHGLPLPRGRDQLGRYEPRGGSHIQDVQAPPADRGTRARTARDRAPKHAREPARDARGPALRGGCWSGLQRQAMARADASAQPAPGKRHPWGGRVQARCRSDEAPVRTASKIYVDAAR